MRKVSYFVATFVAGGQVRASSAPRFLALTLCTILKPQYVGKRTGKICNLVVDLKPDNMFNTIEIDRTNLTIMGVKFSDLKTLESTANALGSNMFEGFKPTPKGIEIIRDYVTGKISLTELVALAKQKAYV